MQPYRGALPCAVSRADDHFALQASRRPLQQEAQHVGRVGIVQKLLVQLGHGRVVDDGHADLRVRDAGISDDGLDRPADATPVDGKRFLTVGDRDGDQGRVVGSCETVKRRLAVAIH